MPNLVREWIAQSFVLSEDWEALSDIDRDAVLSRPDAEAALQALMRLQLLTDYQADRIRVGHTFGLILGNYRILDRIGAGGMAVVYKAEHRRLRRIVAAKVYNRHRDQDPRLLARFYSEARAASQVLHPHIVAAIDAGEVLNPDPDGPTLHYFVMEYVAGQNLETMVLQHGALEPHRACHAIHQIADALREAHQQNLIHRDIKPSNVIVTPLSQAKLLDFGLAMSPVSLRVTEPGTLLGTLGYIAPEQMQDASNVDGRADIFSLGCTLFWALTGRDPFPSNGNLGQDINRRLNQGPPSIRTTNPELPPQLDAVVSRMMALQPEHRYPSAQAVMSALLPFWDARSLEIRLPSLPTTVVGNTGMISQPRQHTVLIVDDEPEIRWLCKLALKSDVITAEEAESGEHALEMIGQRPFDLVLLDIDMPGLNGLEVLERLRSGAASPHLKVILFSGRCASDDLAKVLMTGADDFLKKPFSIVELQGRVKGALRLKDALDRTDRLNLHLLSVNAELERNLSARDGDLTRARRALVLALARLVEHRSTEPGPHLIRLQRYCRVIAEAAKKLPAFAEQIDDTFVETLEDIVPLHDIGKVALPDHILLKPGKLDRDERMLMQAHTTIGADTLGEVAQYYGVAGGFWQLAVDVVRHHHERYDGTGYPDRLAGTDIPLAARIVAIADVYDALRSRRVYKPALSHPMTVMAIRESSPGQFDPALLTAFEQVTSAFERIFREIPD